MDLIEELTHEHIKQFGVEPVIIEINWNDHMATIEGIEKALKNNKPYDEHDLLSEENLEAYKKGDLFF